MKYDHLITHDDKCIKGFFSEYRWLSNFHLCDVEYQGILYPSSENAYQASKVFPNNRFNFIDVSPAKSKKLWKDFLLLDNSPEDWDNRKYDVMTCIVLDKFLRNLDLREKLIATGDKYLEETNNWNDQYYGVDIEKGGLNNLGKMLMYVRKLIK